MYTLRLKSKTAEKWRCYSCCGNSEDYKGEKHSRNMRKFNLVLQVVLTSQQQPHFSPASRHFGSIAKSQRPRNCKFTPVGFCFSSSGKGGRGAKNRWELSASSKMTCLRRCFIYEDVQIKQSQKILAINWRRGLWFLWPSSAFFQTFALNLGEDERAAGTSKLPLSHEKPGLMEGILDV